jgi:AraC family transcriptional regulator
MATLPPTAPSLGGVPAPLPAAPPRPDASAEWERLERAARLIRETYARRPRLRDLAAAAGLSRFHFHRRFKRHFDETPLEMIARLQVERAKRLIRRGVGLREVGRRCGYSNQGHFSARFKQATGVPPSRWVESADAE